MSRLETVEKVHKKLQEFVDVCKQLYTHVEEFVNSSVFKQILSIIETLSILQEHEYFDINIPNPVYYRVKAIDNTRRILIIEEYRPYRENPINGVKFLVEKNPMNDMKYYIVKFRLSRGAPIEYKFVVDTRFENKLNPWLGLNDLFVLNIDLIIEAINQVVEKLTNYYTIMLKKLKSPIENIEEKIRQIQTRIDLLSNMFKKQE